MTLTQPQFGENLCQPRRGYKQPKYWLTVPSLYSFTPSSSQFLFFDTHTLFSQVHPVLTFTVLQPAGILEGTGTKCTSCSQQSSVMCMCSFSLRLVLVANTRDSQGFFFFLFLEEQKTTQLSAWGLRASSGGVAMLSGCDVTLRGHNLSFVHSPICQPWRLCCVWPHSPLNYD